MRLKSVRIENYRSIEDSEKFSINPITCFVGKNESGKTNVLQALYKLNSDVPEEGKFNPLYDYPRRKYSEYKERHASDPDNVLTTIWQLDEKELQELEQKFCPKIMKHNTIEIKKGYNNQLSWTFELNEKKLIENYLSYSELFKEELNELKTSKTISELINKIELKEELEDRLETLLNKLRSDFPENNINQSIIKFLQPKLPIFLYFADYYQLPGIISIDDLLRKKKENRLDTKDRIFMALLNLVGTSPEGIQQIKKTEELIAELEAVSTRMSEEIFEYWSQNRYLEVEFRIDHARSEDPPPYNQGWIFRTRIKNNRHGVTLSFDERSAGFVWFFSFLVWFSQVKNNYGENLVILLDDPGLNLHARAQADLLRYVKERLEPNYQVMYTTHSPFMIDPDNLLNVRMLEDIVTEEVVLGTKVGEKILGVDPDTIFPLQAALGYDITQTLFIGKHCLLVEGPADLLYLKWFSQELQKRDREYLNPKWVITPCGGITKVGTFSALFGANALDIATLTDYSTGQKKKVQELRRSQILKKGHVFSAENYVESSEADIEDMLGREMYITLVDKCYSLEGEHQLSTKKAPKLPVRVLVEVEDHFNRLPEGSPSFDHYKPAEFLIENGATLRNTLPGLEKALDRFEQFFIEVNSLLSDQ